MSVDCNAKNRGCVLSVQTECDNLFCPGEMSVVSTVMKCKCCLKAYCSPTACNINWVEVVCDLCLIVWSIQNAKIHTRKCLVHMCGWYIFTKEFPFSLCFPSLLLFMLVVEVSISTVVHLNLDDLFSLKMYTGLIPNYMRHTFSWDVGAY